MLPRKTIAPKREGNLAWLYPPQATEIDWDNVPEDTILQITDVGMEMDNVLDAYPWLRLADAARIAKRRLRRTLPRVTEQEATIWVL